jgi:PKD repeat protein
MANVITANFHATPAIGVAPLEVMFTSVTSDDVIAWAWDFRDGAASDEPHPVHLYTRPGVYYPTLTVSDGAGTTAIRSVTPIIVEKYPDPVPTRPAWSSIFSPSWYTSPIFLIGLGLVGYVVYREIGKRSATSR